MARGLRNWKFKEHCEFLSKHGFKLISIKGSHYFYWRKDEKEKEFLVQAIQSENPQTLKTMKMSVKHSGIPKSKYFKFSTKDA